MPWRRYAALLAVADGTIVRYRTVREEPDRIADQARCRARGAVAGGGELAWLPNHDYELALTVRTTVDYVESVYPGVGGLLYRSEPVVLAFDERFSTLVPVDRTPTPGDPAERTRSSTWVLAVQNADGRRLSVPAADWVAANRAEH